jgi:hypothetical protein
MTESDSGAGLRPRHLADLTLASGELLPRKRARDQQADLAGMDLKREVLVRLSALDPEPEELDATLAQIVDDLGQPYGPTRAICLSVRHDWEAACQSPEFVSWLLNEALRESSGARKGNRARQPAGETD